MHYHCIYHRREYPCKQPSIRTELLEEQMVKLISAAAADPSIGQRLTVTFTISLPPAMVEELEELMKLEHLTRSEFVREALRRYRNSMN